MKSIQSRAEYDVAVDNLRRLYQALSGCRGAVRILECSVENARFAIAEWKANNESDT